MSNQEALVELNRALQHINNAQELAEREIAAKEIRNLERTTHDCIAGIENDQRTPGTPIDP